MSPFFRTRDEIVDRKIPAVSQSQKTQYASPGRRANARMPKPDSHPRTFAPYLRRYTWIRFDGSLRVIAVSQPLELTRATPWPPRRPRPSAPIAIKLTPAICRCCTEEECSSLQIFRDSATRNIDADSLELKAMSSPESTS